MKKIKLHIISSMLVILSLSIFNGCYTQLAFVNDESNYVNIIEPTPPSPPPPPPPCIDCWGYPPPPPPPPPMFNPLPQAGSNPVATETPSNPHRDTGYQRSESSPNNQTTNSVNAGSRTGGSPRGGR